MHSILQIAWGPLCFRCCLQPLASLPTIPDKAALYHRQTHLLPRNPQKPADSRLSVCRKISGQMSPHAQKRKAYVVRPIGEPQRGFSAVQHPAKTLDAPPALLKDFVLCGRRRAPPPFEKVERKLLVGRVPCDMTFGQTKSLQTAGFFTNKEALGQGP